MLDTNVVIQAINQGLLLPARHYAISVITEMELLSYPALTDAEEIEIRRLLSNIPVVPVTDQIKEQTIRIRRSTGLKLPDSIISATALMMQQILVTDDDQLGRRHTGKTLNLTSLLNLSG